MMKNRHLTLGLMQAVWGIFAPLRFANNAPNRLHKPIFDIIKLYVEDTGIGISREKYNDIFKRFWQGAKGISRKYDGLGLGLSIAKEYTNLLSGEISLESTLGKGTIFYVRIPYATINKLQ